MLISFPRLSRSRMLPAAHLVVRLSDDHTPAALLRTIRETAVFDPGAAVAGGAWS
jgi:hypothetical protein